MKKSFFVILFSMSFVIFTTLFLLSSTAKGITDKPQTLIKTADDSFSPFAVNYNDEFRLFWEERKSDRVSDVYVVNLDRDGNIKGSVRNLTENIDKQSRILSVTELNGSFHILVQNVIVDDENLCREDYEYEVLVYNDYYKFVDKTLLYKVKWKDQFDKPSMTFDGENFVIAYTKHTKGFYFSRNLYLQKYSARWEKQGEELFIDFSEAEGKVSDIVVFDDKGEDHLPPDNPNRIYGPNEVDETASGEDELKLQPQIFFRKGKYNIFLRGKTNTSIHTGLYLFQVEKDFSSYTKLEQISHIKYESFNFRVNHYNPDYEIALWEEFVKKEKKLLDKYKAEYEADKTSRKLRIYQKYKKRYKRANEILNESKTKDAFFLIWEDYKTDHHKYLSSEKAISRTVDKLSPSKFMSNVVKDGESYFYARVVNHFGKERLLLTRANIEELDCNKDIRISKSEDYPKTPFLISYKEIPNNRNYWGDFIKDYSEVIMTTCLFWSEKIDDKYQIMFRKLDF